MNEFVTVPKMIVCRYVLIMYNKLYKYPQMELLQDFYETTLDALKDAKNDRLWFKTNTKLGKLYFDRSDFNKLAKILKQLHQSCQVGIVRKFLLIKRF